MSGIAGIIEQDSQQTLPKLLDYMKADKGGLQKSRSYNNFSLGRVDGRIGGSYFSDNIAVIIDGCIYNTYDFSWLGLSSDNDAEIIAASYRKKGFTETLRLINGDFAIAVYDSDKNTLLLARDRFGLKPVYYWIKGNNFAFASRPGALLKIPAISSQPNRKFAALFAAAHYRCFDNDPDKSPYEDISQLPAASMLTFRNGKINIENYWQLKEQDDFRENENSLAERYRELLFDAVKTRLKKAVKPAFTLSGGMDSSSVLISACKSENQKQHAFSSVYSDKTFDETKEIASMLDAAVKKWHPVHVEKPNVFSLVEDMVKVNDEPVATATWLSHYLLCREVKNGGFKSLFGGLGGDELNAGEYEYYFFHFADLRSAGKEEELKNEVKFWQKYHDHPIYKKNPQVMEDALKRLTDPAVLGKCLPDTTRMKRYFHTLNREFFNLENFSPVMESPFKSYLKNRAFQDITRETAPCCLRAEDRQTSAFALDNFLPFFDHRLVEYMFRIPGHLKIHNGITKVLLREAMKGILPEETRTRIKKTGWNAPAHIWFAHEQREFLYDLIRSQKFRERGIYNVKAVEKLADEHFEIVSKGEIRENHMMFFWQMINLDAWFRLFVEI